MIDRLEAVDEITRLIHRYARFADLNRPEDQAATFAADGVADYGGTDIVGPAAIAAAVAPALNEWVASCHTISNVEVDVTSDMAATAVCYLYAWRRVDVSGEGDYEVRGQYHDELIRTEDGWRFARRTFLTMAATPPRPDVPHIDRRPSHGAGSSPG
jgi:hypothetical protein